MTGFALGDKFIGVSTDNIYTKQELDTKLQDKQNTLIAGQGINIDEDGTISSNTNLDVSDPLELNYPPLPNHGISLNDDGTFTRVEASLNSYTIPYNGNSSASRKIDFLASNLSGQNNNTIPINNYDGAYSQWEAEGTIIHELLSSYAQGGSSIQDCFVFGTLEDNIFTMKAKLGFYPAGASLGSLADTFTQGTWSSKTFTPTSPTSGGTGGFQYAHTGENYYMKFGLNEGGNYAITIFDKATNTLQVHNEYTRGNFKTVLESCNCVLLPFGYNAGGSATEKLSYDTEYNKVLSSTGTELWTATIPNTSETPTLQLNYDNTLTLNGDNLGVNTSNLGLATVATTGSYTDLTNTPEEYVLPTASTDTLGGVKVDGTSIVIADGVISTNTGTGVDTYTKVEVNNLLSTKQDTITPSSPLSITKEVRSNLEGMSYTTDTQGVYSNNSDVWYSGDNYSHCLYIYGRSDLVGGQNDNTVFPNRLAIPYAANQIVKVPAIYYSNDLHGCGIFGKLNSDGVFEPILFTNTVGNDVYVIMDNQCTITSSVNGYTKLDFTNVTNVSYTSLSGSLNTQDYTFAQLCINEDSTQADFVYFCRNGLNRYATITDSTVINRLKQVNCVMVVAGSAYTNAPTYNAFKGRSESEAFPVNSIGLYNSTEKLSTLMQNNTELSTFDFGENLFDLSGEQAYNYLDLSIGAGLSISDGVLVNNNPIPYELPTASVETLGGVKVDGTSIVISDGVISTNTGTEVDAYTKVEVDAKLADKQDILTPASPLSIQVQQINPSNNMQVLDTGDIVSSNTAWTNNANSSKTVFTYNTADGNLEYQFVRNASFDTVQKQLGCMVFPFTYGNIYTLPLCHNNNDGEADTQKTPFALGYYDAEGIFIPVFTTDATSDYFCKFTNTNAIETEPRFNVWGFEFSTDGVYTNSDSRSVSSNNTPNFGTAYFQIFKKPDGNYSFTTVTHYSHHLREDSADFNSTMVADLDKCTHIMLCAWRTNGVGCGVNVSGYNSYNLTTNTLEFAYSENLADTFETTFDYATLKSTANNLFEFENINLTALLLNIDNSTIKVNGSGQLYANIELPNNVLTGSNISQDAYIQQLEARIAALEALIDGGNSTTTILNLSPTPDPQVNDAISETGYTAIDEITVQDGEAE